jgi:hypothetical protein
VLMLVLIEEAYPWPVVFSPYGNVHKGIVPAPGKPILIRLEALR